MTCPCGAPLTSSPIAKGLAWRIDLAVAQFADMSHHHKVRLLRAYPDTLTVQLGVRNRCADCFWWRVALLVGYCII